MSVLVANVEAAMSKVVYKKAPGTVHVNVPVPVVGATVSTEPSAAVVVKD